MPLPDWLKMTTEERVAAILPMVEKGYSSKQIAMEFANASRNAIIGVRHRQAKNLPAARATKPDAAKAKPRPKPKRLPATPQAAPRVAPMPMPPQEAPPEPDCGRPSFLEPGGGCKWPLWDRPIGSPDSWKVCGAGRNAGSSYCSYHASRAADTGTAGERRAIEQAKKAAAR